MLGLHQTHMSYSPADVAAAAALGRGTNKTTSSKLAGGATSGRITSGAGNNSHRRQQLVMAAHLVAQADRDEENSIQTVRMHRIREDKLQQVSHHQRIVQVPPQTAEPLVIESMPKRGGRAATRAAARSQQQQQQQYDFAGVREHHYHQQQDARAHPPDEGSRHFLLRQQQRQMEADNQVVLIMSDTSGARAGANGIPIIGRRLPSKSHPAPQPPPAAAAAAAHQQPVAGRRSHRVVSQRHKQTIDSYHQQESMTRHQSVRQHTQPLSIIETHSPVSERVVRAARVQHLNYSNGGGAERCPSLSVLDGQGHNYDGPAANGAHETFGQTPTRSTRRLAPKAPVGGTKRASSRLISSSCTSLSRDQRGKQQMPPVVLCTDPCCQQQQQAPVPLEQSCMLPCCNLMAAASADSIGRDNIPLLRPAVSGQQHAKQASRRRESARDDLAAYMKPPLSINSSTSGGGGSGGGGGLCHANSNQLPMAAYAQYPLPADGGGTLASRTRRSSSLSRGDQRTSRLLMETVGAGKQRHLAYNLRLGRHQPTTPPPVPSKPNGHHHSHHHHHHLLMMHQQQQMIHQMQQDDDSAVTQMYESLAAELKAKLGNPNRAPILLPPKDYDTLSRQQGRLTGIELRRSTNPQLVGPHTSCCTGGASETSPDPAQAQEFKDQLAGVSLQKPLAGGPTTSVEPTCLQRSRSNSSSGLGSISLGASSPDEHAGGSRPCSPSHCSAACSTGSGADVAFASPSRSSCSGASSSPLGSSGPNCTSQSGESTTTTAHYYEQLKRPSKANPQAAPPQPPQPPPPPPPDARRGKGIENHNPSKVSDGILWNGRVEIPLKVNSERRNGNTYLATKQIIY